MVGYTQATLPTQPPRRPPQSQPLAAQNGQGNWVSPLPTTSARAIATAFLPQAIAFWSERGRRFLSHDEKSLAGPRLQKAGASCWPLWASALFFALP